MKRRRDHFARLRRLTTASRASVHRVLSNGGGSNRWGVKAVWGAGAAEEEDMIEEVEMSMIEEVETTRG